MELRNFINGRFINSISNKTIPVLNPANQKLVGNIEEALDEEINLAYDAARQAFNKMIKVACCVVFFCKNSTNTFTKNF